jgi:hypothetical protein
VLDSSAYRESGALLIAFTGPPGPGRPGPTGALVLSRFTRPGAVVRAPYRPYSLLRTIEDLLGLAPLAHARSAPSFAAAALPLAIGSPR